MQHALLYLKTNKQTDKYKLRSEKQSCSFSLYTHREKNSSHRYGSRQTLKKATSIVFPCSFLTSNFYPYRKSSSLPFSNDCLRSPYLCDPCQPNTVASKMSFTGTEWEGQKSLWPWLRMQLSLQDSSLTIMDLHLLPGLEKC